MLTMLTMLKKIIPKKLFVALQPTYHHAVAILAACIYRFPSRHIHVVAITGTKGKTSTGEIVNALLGAAGKKTALAGTLRFKIGDSSEPNLYKMTMPGRFFVQKFLRKAVNAGCTHVVLEMTSEAARVYRHACVNFDCLLFLNLSPEHIESHGSYELYRDAKLMLAQALSNSSKKRRVIIVNADDRESPRFLEHGSEQHTFSTRDMEPYTLRTDGADFTYGKVAMKTHLKGIFNLSNIAAALTYAETQNIPLEQCCAALETLTMIRGRVEYIREGQSFDVIVDYAHTADSLEKLYQAFPEQKKICVLGNTGGGRDTWKRPGMAKVANTYCDHIILTNEDPYDEDPQKILNDMLPGITTKPYEIILDRREAITTALIKALKEMPGGVVLITGKGTDPFIMTAHGGKVSWDDAAVVREVLHTLIR